MSLPLALLACGDSGSSTPAAPDTAASIELTPETPQLDSVAEVPTIEAPTSEPDDTDLEPDTGEGAEPTAEQPVPTAPVAGTPAPTEHIIEVQGRLTYERVPFGSGAGAGLDYSQSFAAPIRGAVVELIDGDGAGASAWPR